MRQSVKSGALLRAGKRHWPRFLPMWLFPVALLAVPFLPGFENHPGEYFVILVLPALSLCGYPALVGWRSLGITFGQMFFWFALVPFLIWASAIVSIFAFAILGF